MKVRLVKITDLEGNLKDEYAWDTLRNVEKPIVGNRMFLWYIDSDKVRTTTPVTKILNYSSRLLIYTINSIYTLEIIKR